MRTKAWIAALCVASANSANGAKAADNSSVAGSDDGGSGNATTNSVSAYCDSVLQQFFSTYIATKIATTLVPGYDGFGPTDADGQLTGPVTSQSHWTSTYTYTEFPIRAYTAKPPCCSQCYLSAGTMQLIYWPNQQRATKPTTALPSTYTNDDGFTFTSPSVYMAFTHLFASNKCGTVGTVWQNTTLAFNADEITTLNPTITSTILQTKVDANGTKTITNYVTSKPPDVKINYDDLTGDCAITGGYYSYWPGNPFNAGQGALAKDPCRPILKIPDRLISAQPEWVSAGCQEDPGSQGFYDPPITLDTAQVFAKPTFSTTGGGSASSTARPAQSPSTTGIAATTRTAAFTAGSTATSASSQQTGGANRLYSCGSSWSVVMMSLIALLYAAG
ncbi:Hypothetical protein D9617_4g003280 [Elsinoe fawcettii]|nr:Hypothetical protein D9617_4g003280 [Elsinoe fawcettii]